MVRMANIIRQGGGDERQKRQDGLRSKPQEGLALARQEEASTPYHQSHQAVCWRRCPSIPVKSSHFVV